MYFRSKRRNKKNPRNKVINKSKGGVKVANVGQECMSPAAQTAEHKARMKELFTIALFKFLKIKVF